MDADWTPNHPRFYPPRLCGVESRAKKNGGQKPAGRNLVYARIIVVVIATTRRWRFSPISQLQTGRVGSGA
jgi:hypothetical protein